MRLYNEWVADAICPQTDPEAFFPLSPHSRGVAEAKAVCASCLARSECLEYALTLAWEVDGIWGGTTSTDRRRIRRERKALADA